MARTAAFLAALAVAAGPASARAAVAAGHNRHEQQLESEQRTEAAAAHFRRNLRERPGRKLSKTSKTEAKGGKAAAVGAGGWWGPHGHGPEGGAPGPHGAPHGAPHGGWAAADGAYEGVESKSGKASHDDDGGGWAAPHYSADYPADAPPAATAPTTAHSYCGVSWADANASCLAPCPSGTDAGCPPGEMCYADAAACPPVPGMPAAPVGGTVGGTVGDEGWTATAEGGALASGGWSGDAHFHWAAKGSKTHHDPEAKSAKSSKSAKSKQAKAKGGKAGDDGGWNGGGNDDESGDDDGWGGGGAAEPAPEGPSEAPTPCGKAGKDCAPAAPPAAPVVPTLMPTPCNGKAGKDCSDVPPPAPIGEMASLPPYFAGDAPESAPAGTGTVVDLAVADAHLSTLVAALTAAQLAGALNGEGPFTVFAPTDEAFAALPEGTLDELLKPGNAAALVDVLKYHVVEGNYPAAALGSGTALETLNGDSLAVTLSEGGVTVNEANVVAADLLASNGVVHVIDSVLLPPAEAVLPEPMEPSPASNRDGELVPITAAPASDPPTSAWPTYTPTSMPSPTLAALQGSGTWFQSGQSYEVESRLYKASHAARHFEGDAVRLRDVDVASSSARRDGGWTAVVLGVAASLVVQRLWG